MGEFYLRPTPVEDGGKGFIVVLDAVLDSPASAEIEVKRLSDLLKNSEALQAEVARLLAEVAKLRIALDGVLEMALIHPETAYKLAHDALAPVEKAGTK